MQKALSQFIKATYISEKKFQKTHNLKDKTGCQKCKVSVIATAKLTPTNFSILISTKFKIQTSLKTNDVFLKPWLFPFLGHFFHTFKITAFNTKIFSTCFFVYMTLHRKKLKWCMYIHYTIQRPD